MARLEPVQNHSKKIIKSNILLGFIILIYCVVNFLVFTAPLFIHKNLSELDVVYFYVAICVVISQVNLFISIEMVLHFSRYGFYSSILVNAINILGSLIICIFSQRFFQLIDLVYCGMAIFISVIIHHHLKLIEKNVIQLHKIASTDGLTNLSNRQHMITVIDSLISGSKAISSFAVIFIDLDNFKLINDSLGHQIGDIFLCEVVHNLSTALDKDYVFGRMGGDEFLIVVPGEHSAQSLNAVLSKLIKAVSIPFKVKDRTYTCTASFGIARFPEDGDSVSSLLKQSDMAMYQAKTSGKNRGFIFDENMQKKVSRRVQLEQNLRFAIGNGDLEIEYQPQFGVKSRKLRGFEVLLRWDSPIYGWVSPCEFIPIAEENGTIIEISKWMFARAFTEYCKVLSTYDTAPILSVNVSVVQFRDENFIKELTDILNKTKMDPHNLEIEITESVFIKSPEETSKVMQKLRDMGIRIALDDFGTGYSSLMYLRTLPLDTVKIDKSFVDVLVSGKTKNDIVHTIIEMAHQLNLKVIAEGVEEVVQLETLIAYKCDYIQGYYFGKPLPAAGL